MAQSKILIELEFGALKAGHEKLPDRQKAIFFTLRFTVYRTSYQTRDKHRLRLLFRTDSRSS